FAAPDLGAIDVVEDYPAAGTDQDHGALRTGLSDSAELRRRQARDREVGRDPRRHVVAAVGELAKDRNRAARTIEAIRAVPGPRRSGTTGRKATRRGTAADRSEAAAGQDERQTIGRATAHREHFRMTSNHNDSELVEQNKDYFVREIT